VENARQALEEKAKQLALTSKYKSEFLANMSHELRTPLNSLLLLSDQLTKNAEGNLNQKQVESARPSTPPATTCSRSSRHPGSLKIESGTVQVDVSELRLLDLQRYVERTFRHVAESSKVEFNIQLDPALPRSMFTDISACSRSSRTCSPMRSSSPTRQRVVLDGAGDLRWSSENES